MVGDGFYSIMWSHHLRLGLKFDCDKSFKCNNCNQREILSQNVMDNGKCVLQRK